MTKGRKTQGYVLREAEICVGLEDSKKSWKLCVRSGGMIIHEASMPAKYEVLRNYLNNGFPECTVHIIYEAGFRGFELHDQLKADGWDCAVTPPHTVTDERCNRKKNEKHDARRLAKVRENEDHKVCHAPDREQREDRQVSRLSGQIQADITRVCNRIRRALEFQGLDVDLPEGRWSAGNYRDLRRYLKGKDLSPSLQFALEEILDQLHYLRQRKSVVIKELRRIARKERYKTSVRLLSSAPGIGPLTAIRLTLEWGDVSRFESKEEWASFSGLIPSDHSTGEQDHKGHITKQGNRTVRSWLIECSWRAIGKDPVLMGKYQRVLRNSGSKKKAIVAVARKLVVRLRTVLLTGEPYVIGLVE